MVRERDSRCSFCTPTRKRYSRDMVTHISDAPTVVVFACWAVFGVTWAITALFTKRTLERRWSWQRIVFIAGAAVAWLVLRHPGTHHAVRLWRPTPARQLLAAAVAVGGLG